MGVRQLAGMGDQLPAAAAQLRQDSRIRSERSAFDAKYGPLVADLGRDLPQRATKLAQDIDAGRHLEGGNEAADVPAPEGCPRRGGRDRSPPRPAPE